MLVLRSAPFRFLYIPHVYAYFLAIGFLYIDVLYVYPTLLRRVSLIVPFMATEILLYFNIAYMRIMYLYRPYNKRCLLVCLVGFIVSEFSVHFFLLQKHVKARK